MANISSLDRMSLRPCFGEKNHILRSICSHSILRAANRNLQRRTAFSLMRKGRLPSIGRSTCSLRRKGKRTIKLQNGCLLVEGSSSMDVSVTSFCGTAQNDALSVHDLSGDSSLQQLSLDKLQQPEERLPLCNEKLLTSGRLFPSVSKRSEVQLPGIALRISENEVLEKGSNSIINAVDLAIARGITILILESGVEEGSGGAKLYESACVLKALLRGRAVLLVSERVDIAAAAGADGVLLSDKGLPALVARKMLQNANPEASMLPLIARVVETTESAFNATANEGADLLVLLLPKIKDAGTLVHAISERVSIPVFVHPPTSAPMSVKCSISQMWQSGASGFVFQAKEVVCDNIIDITSLLDSWDHTFQQRLTGSSEINDIIINTTRRKLSKIPFKTLDFEAEEILEEERRLLSSIIDVVQRAAPEMEEISLLIEAVAQLDEPFLLVIVGEYNSGKSSLINALLGKKFLKEGILPTTNEITILKYNGSNDGENVQIGRHFDGHFMRYLPAELLKQMNLVDTPGTNVLLQRQERLTEEFIPRADLILFVLSADRPLTESEMSFLRYIRKWGKKVIFILNKVDLISGLTEVEEVAKFITDNVQQLLGVENAIAYPVSARHALQAKINATHNDGFLDKERLSQNPLWRNSGFGRLEVFINDFLDGSSDAGAERRRLKFETPINIAIELLAACEVKLSNEAAKAESDLGILNEANSQLEAYEKMMENESITYCQKMLNLIEAAKFRANRFVDSILCLSNVEAAAKYLLRGDHAHALPVSNAFDKEVIGSSISDVQMLLKERQSWIRTKYVKQVSSYEDLIARNWPELKFDIQQIPSSYQQHSEKKSSASAVLDDFDTKAAIILLEQEIKEVVLSTFGGLGAAGASASILTSILPNTMEDLAALAICSAGGMIGVWNLPSKRDKIKKKIHNVAYSLAKQMEIAMMTELKESIGNLKREVGIMIQPCCDTVQSEVNRCNNLQILVRKRADQLHRIWLRIQNLGIQ